MSKTYTIALEFLDHPVELGCGGAGGKTEVFARLLITARTLGLGFVWM